MHIPAFTSVVAVSKTEGATSRQTSPLPNGSALKAASEDAGTVATASSTIITISGLSRPSKPQVVAGMSTDQLNSMLQTSLKMQSIRNDADLPEEVKKKLLKPLVQANKDAAIIADAKAEQQEKSKIIEASAQDAQAIHKAREEIAASDEAHNTSPGAPAASPVPPGTDDAISATKAARLEADTPAPAQTADAPYAGYSASTLTVGTSVDTVA